MDENKGPDKKFVVGGVSAAIWRKEVRARNGETFTKSEIVLDKLYRGADGAFHSTDRLDVSDLPKAILALSKAYEETVGVRLRGTNSDENTA